VTLGPALQHGTAKTVFLTMGCFASQGRFGKVGDVFVFEGQDLGKISGCSWHLVWKGQRGSQLSSHAQDGLRNKDSLAPNVNRAEVEKLHLKSDCG
jgi:hypothetical protein